jgi:hypothetical protein
VRFHDYAVAVGVPGWLKTHYNNNTFDLFNLAHYYPQMTQINAEKREEAD